MTGLEESFLLNDELEMEEGTEAQAALLEAHREQIQAIMEAARAQWPFLGE